ncbi:MAG: hypothetical protein L6R42_005114, partial [Xanthoria sp. 1 TBL-2021]
PQHDAAAAATPNVGGTRGNKDLVQGGKDEKDESENDERTSDKDEQESEDDTNPTTSTANAKSPTSRASLKEFFVNGDGIHREVMQRELCNFLGPDALARPGVYEGQKGYIVRAVRPFTTEMLDSLLSLSQDYEREEREVRNRPAYTRMHRKDVDPEVLNESDLPWDWDD